ncbi:MAG: hypothetical protein AAF942_01725 [Pseudomonadota bacterium]
MKLSIRNTVFEVFQFLWDNRLDLVRMMAAPVVALSILGIGISALFRDFDPAAEEASISGLQFVGLIIGLALPMLFYVMFAVAWHRRCLRSEEQTTILTALRWDRRKTLFLFRFIMISIIAGLSTLPILVIGGIVGATGALGLGAAGGGGPNTPEQLIVFLNLILIFVFMLVQVRLSLLLPATAIDQKLTLAETWTIGRGNSWRLLSILLLSMAPAMLVLIVVGSAMGAISQATGLGQAMTVEFVVRLVFNLAYYIVIAASVSALSISYRELRQTPSPGMPYQM